MPTIPVLLPPRALSRSANPPAQQTLPRGSLSNAASKPTRAWVPIAFARGTHGDAPESTFLTDRGLFLRASRGETVGKHSTMWRIFTPLDAYQTIAGTLLEPLDEKEQIWLPHPWVSDDFSSLIPGMRMKLKGNDHWFESEPFSLLEMVDSRPGFGAMQRWHYISAIPGTGFIREGWVSFFHLSPVADVREALVWSDRTNPAPSIVVDGIAYVTGEYVRFDFAERNGVNLLPTSAGDRWFHWLSGGPLGFVDGSGLPLVGRMLCLPSVSGSTDTDVQEDVYTLLAAYEAPVAGLAEAATWEGKWLAHKNVPRLRAGIDVKAMAKQQLDAFFADASPRGWYADRLIGCAKTPSQTGDQQDFGSAKDAVGLRGADPRWPHFATYSVAADLFRGFAHFEGGKHLDPNLHLGWTTWGMETHGPSSTDTLGKAPVPFGGREATGWHTYDEQHRSQLSLAATYALTGDPLLRSIIEHASTVDIACHRYRKNSGVDGAARAYGRGALTYANFLLLTDETSETHKRYVLLADDLRRQLLRDWMGAKAALGIDVVELLTDPRMGITWNGQPVPAWSPWQQALLANGAYAMWKTTRNQEWLDVTRRVARTVLKYGYHRTAPGAVLEPCYGVAWVDPSWSTAVDPSWVLGQPLPESYYTGNNTLVNGGGISEWQTPAVMAFVETAVPNDPDLPLAKALLHRVTGDLEAADARTAEWYAIVASVPPVPGAGL